MYRQVPNMITVARLVLTVIFFWLLNYHEPTTFYKMMWVAFGVYLLAVGTDWLDGYLARHWHVESAFGRVVDPFVDKILVCGAFIFFCNTNFIDKELLERDFRHANVTGVAPWMAVLLIGREFLVTGLRGLAESRGIDFRADWAGKVKMGFQCFAIGSVIVDVAVHGQVGWVRYCRDTSIWLTLIVTVLSATSYVLKARKMLKAEVLSGTGL